MSSKKSTASKKKRFSLFNIFPWRKSKHKESIDAIQSDPVSEPKKIYTKNTPRAIKNGLHFQNGISHNKKFRAPPPPEDVYAHKKGLSLDDLIVEKELPKLGRDVNEVDLDMETRSCSALPMLEALERDHMRPSTSSFVVSDHDDSGVDSSKSDQLDTSEIITSTGEKTKEDKKVEMVKLVESVTETTRVYGRKEDGHRMAKTLGDACPSTSNDIKLEEIPTKGDGIVVPVDSAKTDERPPLPVTPPPPLNHYPRRKYRISGRTSSTESDFLKNSVEVPLEEPKQSEKSVYVAENFEENSSSQVPYVERLSNFNLKSYSKVPPIRVSSFDGTFSDNIALELKPIVFEMVNQPLDDRSLEVDEKLNAEYRKLTSLFDRWQAMCVNRENLKTTEGIRLQESLISQHRIVHQLCEKAHIEGRGRSTSTSTTAKISSIRSNASAKKRLSIMTPDVYSTPRSEPLNPQNQLRRNAAPDHKRISHDFTANTSVGATNGGSNGVVETSKRIYASPPVVRRSDGGPTSRRIYDNHRPKLNKAASLCEESNSDDDSSAVTYLSSRTFSSVDVSVPPVEARSQYSDLRKTNGNANAHKPGQKYRVNHAPPRDTLELRNGFAMKTVEANGPSQFDKFTPKTSPKTNTEVLKKSSEKESTASARPTQKQTINNANAKMSSAYKPIAPSLARPTGQKSDVEESRRKYEERKKGMDSISSKDPPIPLSPKVSNPETYLVNNIEAVSNQEKRVPIVSKKQEDIKISPKAREPIPAPPSLPKSVNSTPKIAIEPTPSPPSIDPVLKRSTTPSPPSLPKSINSPPKRTAESPPFLPKSATIYSTDKNPTKGGNDSNENIFGAILKKVGMPVEKVGMQLGRVLDAAPTTDPQKERHGNNPIPPAPPLPSNGSSIPPAPPLPPVNGHNRLDPSILQSQLKTVKLKPAVQATNNKDTNGNKDTRDLLMEAIRQAGGSRSLRRIQQTD